MNVIIQINLEFEEYIEQMIQGSGFPLHWQALSIENSICWPIVLDKGQRLIK